LVVALAGEKKKIGIRKEIIGRKCAGVAGLLSKKSFVRTVPVLFRFR